MSPAKEPLITLRISRSVQFTFAAVAGASVGYIIWKWLGGEERETPKLNRKRRKTVPGLLNVGNSCFMNSLLQCFATCPAFIQWLNNFVESTKDDKDHVYMANVLFKIIKILTGDTELHDYYYDPSELLQDMGGRGWQISSQEQDAHEFFHAVMTTLLEEYHHQVSKDTRPLQIFEVKELLSKSYTSPGITRVSISPKKECFRTPPSTADSSKTPDPPFRGTLACVLKCKTCGYQNPIRYDGFDSLSLPLPSNTRPWSTETNLIDCLRDFVAPEVMKNVDCQNCSRLRNRDANQHHNNNIKHSIKVKKSEPVKSVAQSAENTCEKVDQNNTTDIARVDKSTSEKAHDKDATCKSNKAESNITMYVSEAQTSTYLNRNTEITSSEKTCSNAITSGQILIENSPPKSPNAQTVAGLKQDTSSNNSHNNISEGDMENPNCDELSTGIHENSLKIESESDNNCQNSGNVSSDKISDRAGPSHSSEQILNAENNISANCYSIVESTDPSALDTVVNNVENQTMQRNEPSNVSSGSPEPSTISEYSRTKKDPIMHPARSKCPHLPTHMLNFKGQKKRFENYYHKRSRGLKLGGENAFVPIKRDFLRRLCIGKLPDCLCMHLQRLVWIGGMPTKKTNFVKFPEILDMGQFTEISRITPQSMYSNTDSFKKQIKKMKPSEMCEMLRKRREQRPGAPPLGLQGGSHSVNTVESGNISHHKALYKLASVIVHIGDSSFCGHFFTYRRMPDGKDNEWVFASDTLVRKATQEEVFSCPAYILFYERMKG